MNLDNLPLEERLIVYSWFYKIGKPLISDTKFNQLYNELKLYNPQSPLILGTWSELERPTELLISVGLDLDSKSIEEELFKETNNSFFLPDINMDFRVKYFNETIEYFDRFIPKSIETIDDLKMSREWYRTITSEGKVKFNFSLKADGFNISLFYYKGHYIGARTRGRSGNSEDVSIAMSSVVPMKIKTNETYVRIKSEAVMSKSSLEVLAKMDPSKNWKSTRSSIRSLLVNNIGKEFHRFIIPLGFKVEGVNFATREEELRFLEMNNIQTVYNKSIEIETHDQLLEQVEWFSKYSAIYGTDGCVVTIDSYELFNRFDTEGKYDYAMKAYRLFSWESNLYCSVVLDVLPSYNSKNISLKLSILPTKVSNGSTIRNLDVDNLNRLQRLGLKGGAVVCFDIKSDSCVDLLDNETKILNSHVSNAMPVPEHLKLPYSILESRVKYMLESGDYDV